MCSVLGDGLGVVCVEGSVVPVVLGVFVHGAAAPPAGGAVLVVVEELFAGDLVGSVVGSGFFGFFGHCVGVFGHEKRGQTCVFDPFCLALVFSCDLRALSVSQAVTVCQCFVWCDLLGVDVTAG